MIRNVRTTRSTFTLHGGNNGGSRNNQFPKTNPHEQLHQGSVFNHGVVGIGSLGDGAEGVHVSRKTDKVGGDETNNSQHGSAAVSVESQISKERVSEMLLGPTRKAARKSTASSLETS